MTLILTALCKNGIYVCADTRYQLKNDDGSVKNKDGNYKIYKFDSNNISLIIFNHSVNEFVGRSWKQLCSEYESSGRWRNKTFELLCADFKEFIENVVLQ
jgi:hypothetical protein